MLEKLLSAGCVSPGDASSISILNNLDLKREKEDRKRSEWWDERRESFNLNRPTRFWKDRSCGTQSNRKVSPNVEQQEY